MHFPTYLDQYNEFVAESAIFPPDKGIQYCITKLGGEIGEVNDKISQHLQLQYAFTDDYFRVEIERKPLILELGDVTWYCAALLRELGTDIGKVNYHYATDAVVLPPAIKVMGLGLRLSAIVGRINERAGKFVRDKGGDFSNSSFLSNQSLVVETIEDVNTILNLVDKLADVFDHDLDSVVALNIDKLESRRARNVLQGSGDNR